MSISYATTGISSWSLPTPKTLFRFWGSVLHCATRAPLTPSLPPRPRTRQVNPQWNTTGNLVSDFGFGPWRQRAEAFVDTFSVTYSLEECRIGNPSSVDPRVARASGLVWVLQSLPATWQVYLVPHNASPGAAVQPELLAVLQVRGCRGTCLASVEARGTSRSCVAGSIWSH